MPPFVEFQNGGVLQFHEAGFILEENSVRAKDRFWQSDRLAQALKGWHTQGKNQQNRHASGSLVSLHRGPPTFQRMDAPKVSMRGGGRNWPEERDWFNWPTISRGEVLLGGGCEGIAAACTMPWCAF